MPQLFLDALPRLCHAIYPTGPENESCDDFDHDPETEAILYEDFLSIGEAEEKRRLTRCATNLERKISPMYATEITPLNHLQKPILSLMQIPESIYTPSLQT